MPQQDGLAQKTSSGSPCGVGNMNICWLGGYRCGIVRSTYRDAKGKSNRALRRLASSMIRKYCPRCDVASRLHANIPKYSTAFQANEHQTFRPNAWQSWNYEYGFPAGPDDTMRVERCCWTRNPNTRPVYSAAILAANAKGVLRYRQLAKETLRQRGRRNSQGRATMTAAMILRPEGYTKSGSGWRKSVAPGLFDKGVLAAAAAVELDGQRQERLCGRSAGAGLPNSRAVFTADRTSRLWGVGQDIENRLLGECTELVRGDACSGQLIYNRRQSGNDFQILKGVQEARQRSDYR